MTRALSFRLWGDYGHFKKYYTTTSPLTFEFPPPPTLIGIISAIIGLDRDEYLNRFQDGTWKIAVCIMKPVKKVRWTVNLVDTKQHFWKIENRTQIRTEYLKDPDFRIFFHHTDKKIYSELKHNLMHHYSVYSVSLGLSELLGDFEYCGEEDLEEYHNSDWQPIRSVVPVSCLLDDSSIRFGNSLELFKVNYPVAMSPDRSIHRRDEVIFERCTGSITCRVNHSYETGDGDRIVFF